MQATSPHRVVQRKSVSMNPLSSRRYLITTGATRVDAGLTHHRIANSE
jgi:hypothetical protein